MKFSTATLVLAITGLAWALQGYQADGPRSGSLKGMIMGEDYTTLLGNPTLKFQVEQGPSTVYFVWTSDNPARIEEVLRMGDHIHAAKRDLELQGEGLRDVDEAVRTAKKN